ncbi:purine-cytosine permease FCY21 [Aureobasidium pullulans]|uniref:Purine-cytosine permease FCY21 n=1 Tax=Aureobasidium pullulans TaxID=5580 RepID=A0A4S8Z5D3_AURPU|nr:purine-cytosine permease FCY21 [Aureobasidium pullulans]TIA00379.1 purine-cytosine permease FCY21 [Aureobasidium pullulans]
MDDQSQMRNSNKDLEKDGPTLMPVEFDDDSTLAGGSSKLRRQIKNIEHSLAHYNLEARGIHRVMPNERHSLRNLGYSQVGLLWFSVNLAANNITLGMLGPAVYYLSFLDCSLCAVFGMLVGCLPVAYVATFGPVSGNRSMVFARYTMGWYPAKLVVVLNIIVLLGYCLIDAVVAGQILSAVSPNGSLSVIVGIVIVAVLTWGITIFGYSVFHFYERYAWLPQLIVLSTLAGVAGPKFDLETPSSGDTLTIIGNRLSFFSLCLSAAITYAGGAADFFVYYPEETPRWKIFSVTMCGLALSFTFAFMVGIGLGSGVATTASWSDAYNVSQGALIVEGFAPLGSFGKFCGVIVALGLIANMIAPTYSAGMDFQVLGQWMTVVPRFVWNTLGVVIYTVCAIAGRGSLAAIFTNFLALMGYWVSIWIAISLEEHFIFRTWRGIGFNWNAWNDKSKLPIGIAAIIAFLIGWAGAILCMAQVWYIGPLAKQVGEYGADMGNYVGFAWAAVVYPPLRWFEMKKFGR